MLMYIIPRNVSSSTSGKFTFKLLKIILCIHMLLLLHHTCVCFARYFCNFNEIHSICISKHLIYSYINSHLQLLHHSKYASISETLNSKIDYKYVSIILYKSKSSILWEATSCLCLRFIRLCSSTFFS